MASDQKAIDLLVESAKKKNALHFHAMVRVYYLRVQQTLADACFHHPITCAEKHDGTCDKCTLFMQDLRFLPNEHYNIIVASAALRVLED